MQPKSKDEIIGELETAFPPNFRVWLSDALDAYLLWAADEAMPERADVTLFGLRLSSMFDAAVDEYRASLRRLGGIEGWEE